jgi:hypothetical protein
MRKLAIIISVVFAIAASACVTNRTALNVSRRNAINITDVKLGQTIDQVQATMKHPPESRDVRTLPDGSTEESWNYLTDYDNDTNTTLLFRNGRLAEITHTRWLGNGIFPK